MGIVSWIVMGLLVGILAKIIMPGKDPRLEEDMGEGSGAGGSRTGTILVL